MKFSDEYKLTEYYQVQSTIDYITKGKNKLSAGSYGDGQQAANSCHASRLRGNDEMKIKATDIYHQCRCH